MLLTTLFSLFSQCRREFISAFAIVFNSCFASTEEVDQYFGLKIDIQSPPQISSMRLTESNCVCVNIFILGLSTPCVLLFVLLAQPVRSVFKLDRQMLRAGRVSGILRRKLGFILIQGRLG